MCIYRKTLRSVYIGQNAINKPLLVSIEFEYTTQIHYKTNWEQLNLRVTQHSSITAR